MEQKRLGKQGLTVSALGLGCMGMSDAYGPADEAESIATIHRALDLEDPVITAIAKRVSKTPAQVLLAWAIQRGTALLTTSKTPSRIKENFDVSILPKDAMREISEGIKSRVRFNAVVETGVPGFIPRGKGG